jgi:NADH dehydrogenase [ubiquinone] 1 alpha subcomplex assembly factor 7
MAVASLASHMTATPLEAIIARIIRDEGPMPLDRYMQLCLGHPEHGYYMKRDPFGERGDFITAPEVSQIFGELIGVWCATAFEAMGAPRHVNLIELGPGRGTLMKDVLRPARLVPEFARSVCVHLVETSPALRRVQEQTLSASPVWHDGLATLPDGPSIVIANEFLDAIPIWQFEYRDGHWMERCVGLTPDGRLAIGLNPSGRTFAPSHDGAVIEISPLREAIARALGARLAASPGAALIIDYGHVQSAPGDTLQAVRAHRFCSILDFPGESDLTSHVDFQSIAQALREGGAEVHGPLTQRQFLLAMGLEPRAAALSKRASPSKREIIARAMDRLAGEAQMGNLFKVVAATTPGLSAPYPFGSHDRGS